MEVTRVDCVADVNKVYVGRTAGINGTIIDLSNDTGDRINRIVYDGSICIVARKNFQRIREGHFNNNLIFQFIEVPATPLLTCEPPPFPMPQRHQQNVLLFAIRGLAF
jgi:hypothetical protein